MKAIISILVPVLLAITIHIAAEETSNNGDPSVNGKYRSLIQTVSCHQDKAQYGENNDFGYWSGTNYCGQAVSPGWWVYVHPDWHIWRENTRIEEPDPMKASVNGRYETLLNKVMCPQDRGQYGEFNEYGQWQGTQYCGQQVTPGWWVYAYPYWFVWGERR